MGQLVFLTFLILAALGSALDHSLITVSIPPASGVLLLTGPKGLVQFNFSEANEACLFKNVSMATRSQLQKALDHGLEACRFGWIQEQVAAIPRLSSVSTCGSGKTGVVTWRAPLQQRFGVWCFSQSDFKEAERATTVDPQITNISTTTAALPRTTTTFTTTAALTTTEMYTTATTTAQATTNPATKPLSTTTRTVRVTSASASWVQTTVKPRTPESVSTQFTTVASKFQNTSIIASSSTAGSTSAIRQESSKPAVNSVSVKPPRKRALSTALIAFCVIVLVLSAGGAVVYYKLSGRWVWPHAPQKDDIDTETWKQTCSELELQEDTEGEGRRFSSETMLYISSDA